MTMNFSKKFAYRLTCLIGFFSLVLLIFPLTHLLIILWGDLFSARLMAQRLLPNPTAGYEWDYSSDDPIQWHMRFISAHTQGYPHISSGVLGDDFLVEAEELAGLPSEVANHSLWHGVQLKALADNFEGINNLILAYMDVIQDVSSLDNGTAPSAILSIDDRGHALNRRNRETLEEIIDHIYLRPLTDSFPLKSELARLHYAGELTRRLSLNSGYIPKNFHKAQMAEVMLEIDEIYHIPAFVRSLQTYLLPHGGFTDLRHRVHGPKCWDDFLTAAQGFDREFTRQSLNTAMDTICSAQQSCHQSPLATDWLAYMAAQTLNRQVWEIDHLVFERCTSVPILEHQRVYPPLTQTHSMDLAECQAAHDLQEKPILLSPYLTKIEAYKIRKADNLSDDLAYISGKLALYQFWGFVD